MKIELSKLPDYPPRIVMDISRSATSTSDGPPPGLQVVGLDRECCFTLPTPRKITVVSKSHNVMKYSYIMCAY